MTTLRVVAFRGDGMPRQMAVLGPREGRRGTGVSLGPRELADVITEARLGGTSPARLLAEEVEQSRRGRSAEATVDEEAALVGVGGRLAELDVPLLAPEVWAAGVTYLRSRDARQAETAESTRDVYARVYEAERPELFLKDAAGRRTVGPAGFIRARSDSHWTVPEPELGLVLDADGRIVGYVAGDDVSARDIEGENPLYLPQAKVYRGSCALGPAVLLTDEPAGFFPIELRIRGADKSVLFEARTSTERIVRSFESLAQALVRDNPLGDGTVLLTGTGIVPPDGFTLEAGQIVEVEIGGIGMLWNGVASADAAG
jgi:2-dehydro-3-deoxy-D-arabinonate dehydratase